jgi:hypothetical protein
MQLYIYKQREEAFVQVITSEDLAGLLLQTAVRRTYET